MHSSFLGGVLLEGWQICRRYSVPVSVKGGISVQKKKGMNVKGKQLLRKPAFFCDLINGGLFNGRQRILPHMLRGMPEVLGYSSDDRGKKQVHLERIPDVIYAAGNEEDYLLLMDENQQQTDFSMPLRNMLNTALAYMQQKKQIEELHRQRHDLKSGSEYLSGFAEQDRLHPVICIIFYHGEIPWEGGTSLYDILRFPAGFDDMKRLCPDFPMNLIHAWNVEPEHFRTELRVVFELLPHAADKERLQEYVRRHPQHFRNLTAEECDMLEVFIGMKNLGETEREGYRNDEGGYDMCTALVELRQEGREEGKMEGEIVKIISIVRKKLRKGKSLSVIAEELEETEEIIAPVFELVKAYPDTSDDDIYAMLGK